MKKLRSFDVFGNIAIVKFPSGLSVSEKKKFANKILKENGSVRTILEKVGKFSGRLRKMRTKHVAGEKTKEVLYKENDCVFRFNIDTTYFSSRLSNERKEVASKIKKKDKVLVMFAGVAPFSIIIAKKSGAEVWSNELNREANKYAKLNIDLNKLKERVHLVSGDVKKVFGENTSAQPNSAIGKSSSISRLPTRNLSLSNNLAHPFPKKFDVIVMPRPNLQDTFLAEAFKVSKKGTRIFYYGFCEEKEKDKIIEQIKEEAKKARKKIKILKSSKAGEIGPYKIRLRVEFRVL